MSGVLSVDGVRVSFGGIHALNHVSFEIEEGICCGIIGPNGSGKTTLIGAISRLTRLNEGSLRFGDTDYTRYPPARAAQLGIARTFQAVRLLPAMNVVRNVMVGAACATAVRPPLWNMVNVVAAVNDNRQARKLADEMLETVGLREYASALPHDLPYGLQRRVEIARALATKPRLLLLDEPMAGMSHTERGTIAELMHELRSTGLTQVLVEHDLNIIHQVSDTAIALDFGKVIATGDSRSVAMDPAVREAYLGHDAATAPADAENAATDQTTTAKDRSGQEVPRS